MRFFKVLFNTDFSERLELPPQFIHNVNGDLPDAVELKDADGDVWSVKLNKMDGHVFLLKGWEEYARHHALERFCFLMFKYKGQGQLKVHVFNRTTCTEAQSSRLPSGPSQGAFKIKAPVDSAGFVQAQKKLRFCKVLSDCDFNERLRLPQQFIYSLDGNVSYDIELENPFGDIWKVQLKKVNSQTYFQSGWNSFVEDHCIKQYYFVVFKYKGKGRFKVLLFDATACENKKFYLQAAMRRYESNANIKMCNTSVQEVLNDRKAEDTQGHSSVADAKQEEDCYFEKVATNNTGSISPEPMVTTACSSGSSFLQ